MARRPRAIAQLAATGTVLAACAALAAIGSAPAQGDLSSIQAKERELRARSQFDSRRISHYSGPIADLRAREDGLQRALDTQQQILDRLQGELRADRARLVRLRGTLARDRRILASQLKAVYETPDADILSVILDAHGFADLLERVDQLKAIGRHNAQVTDDVGRARKAVARQTTAVAADERRQRQVTAAALTERDQVSQVRIALVARQMVFIRARNRHSAKLADLGRRAGPTTARGASSRPRGRTTASAPSRRSRRAWTASARRCTCISSACRAIARRSTPSRSAASPTTPTPAARPLTRPASRGSARERSSPMASRVPSPAPPRPITSSYTASPRSFSGCGRPRARTCRGRRPR